MRIYTKEYFKDEDWEVRLYAYKALDDENDRTRLEAEIYFENKKRDNS